MIASSQRPLIVYVSEIAPIETQASSVVIFRHLKALEELGYDICVIGPDNSEPSRRLPVSWQFVPLPCRRPYYPPYRPYEPLRMIRWFLLDRIVRPAIAGRRLHCVIGLLMGEYLVGYAEWTSRRLKLPLFYFYHDRGEYLNHADNPVAASRLRRQNVAVLSSPYMRRVWTVTPELRYDVPHLAGKFTTVYPLPEPVPFLSSAVWRDEFRRAPTIAYSGSIYNEIVPSLLIIAAGLRTVGGRLLLSSHLSKTAEKLQAAFPDVVSYEGNLGSTLEVCAMLRNKATAFLVIYPDQVCEMPWSLDCFPSKLTQFAQTGLPGVIIAPPETAVAGWCVKREWLLYRPKADSEAVSFLLDALRQPESWNHAAADTRRAATGDFLPARLEKLVNDDILLA